MKKNDNDQIDRIQVTINGRTRLPSDLAWYANADEREAVHMDIAPCTDQEYWEAFAKRFPASIEHLLDITPEVSNNNRRRTK